MTKETIKPFVQYMREAKRDYFKRVLAACDGNVKEAADLAQVHHGTVMENTPYKDTASNRETQLRSKSARLGDKAPKRIETLLTFFGVVVEADRTSNFWSRHRGSLDVIYFDARRNYLAMVRRFHPDGRPGNEAEIRKANAAWALLQTAMRKHGVEC